MGLRGGSTRHQAELLAGPSAVGPSGTEAGDVGVIVEREGHAVLLEAEQHRKGVGVPEFCVAAVDQDRAAEISCIELTEEVLGDRPLGHLGVEQVDLVRVATLPAERPTIEMAAMVATNGALRRRGRSADLLGTSVPSEAMIAVGLKPAMGHSHR